MIEPQIWIMSLVLALLVLAGAGAALWVRRVAHRAQLEQLARDEAVRVAVEHRRLHGPRYLKLVYGASSGASMRIEGSVDGVNYAPIDPGGLDPPDFDQRFKLGPPGDGVRFAEAIAGGPPRLEPHESAALVDGSITLLGRACDNCGAPFDEEGFTLCKPCRDLEDAYAGNVE